MKRAEAERKLAKMRERVNARSGQLNIWAQTTTNPDFVDAKGQRVSATVEVDGKQVSVHSREYYEASLKAFEARRDAMHDFEAQIAELEE